MTVKLLKLIGVGFSGKVGGGVGSCDFGDDPFGSVGGVEASLGLERADWLRLPGSLMEKTPHPEERIEFKHEHSLTSLELRMQLQSDDFAGAENKSQQYINVSAIVVAVIGAFTVSQPDLDDVTLVLLLVLLLGVALAFYFALKSISPRVWRQFLNTEKEREQFRDWVKTSTDMVYHETILNTYLSIIEANDVVLAVKRELNRRSRFWVRVQLVTAFALVVYRLFVRLL